MISLLQRREQGLLPGGTNRHLHTAVSGDASFVERLELQRTLDGHAGCVNTVCFNRTGDLLCSGSDDRQIKVWDWAAGRELTSYDSRHRANVFQARFMPESCDKTIITCARDGQVRVGFLREGGGAEVHRLATHSGAAHKLALDLLTPSAFYSCGEDGDVRHVDLRQSARAVKRLLSCRAPSELAGSGVVGLYAIDVNPARPWQFAVSGRDPVVRVYDHRFLPAASTDANEGGGGRSGSYACLAEPVARLVPAHLASAKGQAHQRRVHCTCVRFSRRGQLLASYNDEDIYLFAADAVTHGGARAGTRRAASSSDGRGPAKRSRVQDDRGGGHALAAAAGAAGVEAAEPLCSSGGARVTEPNGAWRSTETDAAERPWQDGEASSSGHSSSDKEERGGGDEEREGGEDWVINRFKGHRNCQTVKGVNFMGEGDQFVVSGSDDGHVYIWKADSGQLHAWLPGDSSVVNCLEPHPALPFTLATSGIDDDIKIWEPTAASSRRPGGRAEAVMARNSRNQGDVDQFASEQMELPPQLLMQLLQLQQHRQARRLAMRAARGEGAASAAVGSSEEEEEESSDAEFDAVMQEHIDDGNCIIS